ncbi:MAG: HAMP domain-containing sensor histidine kinase, partial [Bacteroidota bacterium]
TNLIEDLLVYSKVNLEESQLVSIDLNDLLITLLPDFSYDLNTGKVIIEIDKLPIVEGNKSLLKTVFHNLISNAIKYQPKGEQNHQAHVKIWCEESESDHQVFIQDNGIGIEPEYVDRLFQPFVRFHSSAEYVGTGLGMSICQRIMSNHEGRIDLADTSPRGSLFKLTFPRTKCQITSVNTIDPSVKELSTAS